jgi:hypothetical protein
MLGLIKSGKQTLAVCLAVCLFPSVVLANEVGRFTQVEGKVELKKHGQIEFMPIQPDAGIGENEAVKTAALSWAQIQFLDASQLLMAPLSNIFIKSYTYDSQKQRRALCRVSQGLVRLIVNPQVHLEKNGFLIKTKTAFLWIQGADFYILVSQDFTDVLVRSGNVVAVSDSETLPETDTGPRAPPELSNLLKQAGIRAAADNRVLINSMEASRLAAGHNPSPIMTLNEGHFQVLESLMHTGLPPKMGYGGNPGELLEKISQTGFSSPIPPPPPVLPADIGPSFPGGGGGGIASPSS